MKTKGKWDHARVLHICTCPNNAAMNAHVDKCSFDLWRGEIFAIHCIALACVLHLTASGHCGQEQELGSGKTLLPFRSFVFCVEGP